VKTKSSCYQPRSSDNKNRVSCSCYFNSSSCSHIRTINQS